MGKSLNVSAVIETSETDNGITPSLATLSLLQPPKKLASHQRKPLKNEYKATNFIDYKSAAASQ
jgi:hypothetical protein